MHCWGDEDVDWKGIDLAAAYIADYCRRWARLYGDYKEKYGTIRFYAHFGLSLHSLWFPGHVFYRFPKWLIRFDIYWFTPACKAVGLSRLWSWWQAKIYRSAYARAIARWPHLKQEILSCADAPDLLEGL